MKNNKEKNQDKKSFYISIGKGYIEEGKLSYSDRYHSWNTIRFKASFINQFPELKEKRSSFKYRMVIYRSFDDVEEEIKEMKKEGNKSQILLFLCKESSLQTPIL